MQVAQRNRDPVMPLVPFSRIGSFPIRGVIIHSLTRSQTDSVLKLHSGKCFVDLGHHARNIHLAPDAGGRREVRICQPS
jgi:hypothetical protein